MSPSRKRKIAEHGPDEEQDLQDLQDLQVEMELVQHGTSKNGYQLRRKLPRLQQKFRTIKRRSIEKTEHKERMAVANDGRRLRGSKAAAEESVIMGSLIYGPSTGAGDGAEESDASEVEEAVEDVDPSKDGAKKNNAAVQRSSRKARTLPRIRNFKSQRMAKLHGEAMGAHARGDSRVAIDKLQRLGQDAPSAPQVYSSLGLIYEHMLQTSVRESQSIDEAPPIEKNTNGSSDTGERDESNMFANTFQLAQSQLAKKAYGSYHVAALLCRQDYSLWVRAADMAMAKSDVHTEALESTDISLLVRSYHEGEKQRWLNEAKSDYSAADRLRPDDVDVPAKLANVLIDLGCLSEALTLLTDIKQRPAFEHSYRAWLLYSELMLRIGHECTIWNDGMQNNDNYMFRRWLKKYSTLFDWRGRRVQALSKALATAIGTKSSEAFVSWLQEYAAAQFGGNSSNPEEEDMKPNNDDEERDEVDMELLARDKLKEISDFDQTTKDMDLLEGSLPAIERERARDELIVRQASISNSKANVDRLDQQPSTSTYNNDHLTMKASCATVWMVASQLMRELVALQLYKGARLAAEAVVMYMQERAARHDRRVDSHRRTLESNQGLSIASLATPHAGSHANGDESDDLLSDDEDLPLDGKSDFVDSLRTGDLPTELRVIMGIAMIGEGSKNFLASKWLTAIKALPDEKRSARLRDVIIDNQSTDSRWKLMLMNHVFPVGATQCLAMLTDAVNSSTGRKRDASLKMIGSHFVKYTADIETEGDVDEMFREYRKTGAGQTCMALQIIMAALRYKCLAVDCGVEELLSCLSTTCQYVRILWKVDGAGSLSPACVKIIEVAAVVSKRLRDALLKSKNSEAETKALSALKVVAELFCGTKLGGGKLSSKFDVNDLRSIPLTSSWMSSTHERIALRTFNLCVAKNVSLFSGWERSEFHVEHMRHQAETDFCGVTSGEVLGGYAGALVEQDLHILWNELLCVASSIQDFDFAIKLSAVKGTDWYKTCMDSRIGATGKIASYSEDAGLSILSDVALFCLLEAKRNEGGRYSCLLTALSIMCPVTQFCLNSKVWESSIGNAAITLRTSELKDAAHRKWTEMNDDRQREASRRVSRRSRPKIAKSSDATRWFDWEDEETPGRNLFPVSCSDYLARWNSFSDIKRTGLTKDSVLAMEAVDQAMKTLRKCYTDEAIETASHTVAVALLKLASTPSCSNPFAVIMQASSFASQAAFGGTSDEAFRAPLPPVDCSALVALGVLGKAECLQSLHFCKEAAFLCGYIVGICGQRRNGERTDLEWTDRWKAVSVFAYNVSVSIRLTATTLHSTDKLPEWPYFGNESVLEELKRAHSDASSWCPGASAFGGDFGCVETKAQFSETYYEDIEVEGGEKMQFDEAVEGDEDEGSISQVDNYAMV